MFRHPLKRPIFKPHSKLVPKKALSAIGTLISSFVDTQSTQLYTYSRTTYFKFK